MSCLPCPERLTFNCTAEGSRWPYLLQQPLGEPQALLLYLHGHYGDEWQGMTEGDFDDAFGRLRRECLQRNWLYVCPWYGGNSWMGPLAEAGLVDLIGILRESWPEIPLYLTGGSMGGASALVFATRRPDLLAGVAALCPPADVLGYYSWGIQGREENPTLANITAAIRLHYSIEGRELAEELRARSTLQNASNPHLPVYLSHGAQDPLVPVTWTRLLAAKLRELGYPVEYDELPEGVHDTPVREVDWERVLAFLTQAQ